MILLCCPDSITIWLEQNLKWAEFLKAAAVFFYAFFLWGGHVKTNGRSLENSFTPIFGHCIVCTSQPLILLPFYEEEPTVQWNSNALDSYLTDHNFLKDTVFYYVTNWMESSEATINYFFWCCTRSKILTQCSKNFKWIEFSSYNIDFCPLTLALFGLPAN